jgi:D-beta-D-heptose 7-phosphate kinase/D-beta-D-heptose 1-phosphate adenosyltransferase
LTRSSPDRVRELVARFEGARLLVMGDVILDRYVWGSVGRISPEAPVPVVQVTRESTMLGGAGNVARNLAALGAHVEFVSLIGDDETAAEIVRLVTDWKMDPGGLVVDPERPTTSKTRVIAGRSDGAAPQQLVRFDRELEEPVDPRYARPLIEAVRARVGAVDGVILQDYAKGLLTRTVIEESMRIFAERGLPVFVDPKAEYWDLYAGAELLKPNLREAQALTEIRVRDEADVARVGRRVLEQTGARTVAITRSQAGMTLFYSDGSMEHFATEVRAVAEASGAGDTVIATLALSRLAGATWAESAEISNAAAGIVVRVPGTATLTRRELCAELGAAM